MTPLHARSDYGLEADAVVRVSELAANGVASATTYRRCRPGGPWQRLLPGVVLLRNGPVSTRQRMVAALLYAGPRALVTGIEACRGHGLRSATQDGAVHVLVPIERKVHTSEYVVIERTERMPAAEVQRGIAVAPVHRAALDACRRMADLDSCRELLTEVVQRRKASLKRLAEELDAGSSRGSALPRRVLAEMRPGAHSVAEIHASRLWARAGIGPASWNGRLFTRDGEFIASPDAWSEDAKFAWEVDSVTHHGDLAGFRRTLARNARYTAAGVLVLQTLPERLRSEPSAVIAELRATYAAAATRPQPPVAFRPAD